jgi:hypothetical protein
VSDKRYTTVRITEEASNRLAEMARKGHRTKLGQVEVLIELAEQIERDRGEENADENPNR